MRLYITGVLIGFFICSVLLSVACSENTNVPIKCKLYEKTELVYDGPMKWLETRNLSTNPSQRIRTCLTVMPAKAEAWGAVTLQCQAADE